MGWDGMERVKTGGIREPEKEAASTCDRIIRVGQLVEWIS